MPSMSPEKKVANSEVVDVIALAGMAGGAASDYNSPMPGGMGSSPPGGMGLERYQSGVRFNRARRGTFWTQVI